MDKCDKCESGVFYIEGNSYCQSSEELIENCDRTVEQTNRWKDWCQSWRIMNYGTN